ncbi:MAG: dihydropteroate synthase [Alphaproteobacteria bacterium]|nr:dihydropteroate synthase [Alphaproteobacteria bacterium]
MAILNVTPDSFSDGGRYSDPQKAAEAALRLVDDGADIIDVGGESTRPGAEPVSTDQELGRVIPVIEAIRARIAAPISIDTRKPEVARLAIAAGASIWNDVSALTCSAESPDLAARLGCDVVLMHAQGDPQTMQRAPSYSDVVGEVHDFLEARVTACLAAGIARERIYVDPGIGFGKTLEHNLALLRALPRFKAIAPVLLGASRKRFIAGLDRDVAPTDRIGGSIAAALAGAAAGVAVVRVHDVAETRQALAVWSAISPMQRSQ